MLRATYSTLLFLGQPVIAWQLKRRAQAYPQYRPRLKEHWGFYDKALFKNSVWIHAASMGEVAMAKTLIQSLQKKQGDLTFTLTTNTVTGAESAKEIISDHVQHVFFPIDRPAVLRRFFKVIQPRAMVLIEKELWPNALYFCQKHSVPVTLVNGSLSAKSANRLQKLGKTLRQLFLNIDCIAAQSDADVKKFIRLAVPEDRVHLAGNIKFDMTIDKISDDNLAKIRSLLGEERLILVAGSTHDGEDSILLACYRRLKQDFPNLLLVLVPRHPERFETVAKLCDNNRFQLVRRSEDRACKDETDVFLGDSMGELASWYQAATVAFVGGSLVPKGGHNTLEPIALGTPTITGQHTFNCQAVIDDLLTAGAILTAQNEDALYMGLKSLLGSPNQRQLMAEAGRQVLQSNLGAIDKSIALINFDRKTSCCG